MQLMKLFILPLLLVLGMSPVSDDQPQTTGTAIVTTSDQTKLELFKYLRCHRQAKNIVINWGTTAIEEVNHFIVYHSEDGEFYDPIAEVYPDGELKYSYKHLSVFPGYHYYYISAVMFTGPAVNSDIDIVRIVGH